jgi:iron complex transport system substrate-binding protein
LSPRYTVTHRTGFDCRRALVAAARALASAAAIAATVTACSSSATGRPERVAGQPAALVDDFGDTVPRLASPPARIVSLDPAATAILFAMGDGGRVVGRTRWDTYPPAVQSVTNVGDGLKPNVEAVLAQHPDLVVLFASADDRAAADALRRAGIATLSLRVDRVDDFARAAGVLGIVLQDSAAAAAVRDSVLSTIAHVRAEAASLAPVTAVWLIDESPLRVIGGGSYLSTLVTDAGGRNLYAAVTEPAPQVSLEDVLRRDPDVVLTSPTSAREMRTDPSWHSWIANPHHRILVPDTGLVGMPSVRMGEATAQLAALLHPTASF